jgi:hypothetical protein
MISPVMGVIGRRDVPHHLQVVVFHFMGMTVIPLKLV